MLSRWGNVICFILFPIVVSSITGYALWGDVVPYKILLLYACLVEAVTVLGAWLTAYLFNI